MSKPAVLDLFCGAGGASMGYHQAGFEVVGVDIKPQPNYPFKFIQGDALEVFKEVGYMFDFFHASPPCQAYSVMSKRWGRGGYPELIEPTRELLSGLPYAIENVPSAPLIEPTTLCGSMFNLEDTEGRQLKRHRRFETSFPLKPLKCSHKKKTIGVYGHPGGSSKRDGLVFAQLKDWKDAMQIDWMSIPEITESIPPAYTRYVGEQVKEYL